MSEKELMIQSFKRLGKDVGQSFKEVGEMAEKDFKECLEDNRDNIETIKKSWRRIFGK